MIFYIPAAGAESWQNFLADPEKQWKPGYSAYELAVAWTSAQERPDGLPPAVSQVFSSHPVLSDARPLLGIPEYRVPIPGGARQSQNDIFILARDSKGLLPIMVEGKVNETFGPLVSEWLADASAGKEERLGFLTNQLKLDSHAVKDIRYQLLHRAYSVLYAAAEFRAVSGLMLVHSFNAADASFDDYARFLRLYEIKAAVNSIVGPVQFGSTTLFFGWVRDSK